MEILYIPQLLKTKSQHLEIKIDECLAELNTLTPVRGSMTVRHGGTFLEVTVTVHTIMTLTCDRCLQQYNHRLAVNTKEIIWLDRNADDLEDLPLEREVHVEDLSESLPMDGHFDPNKWLYEQICLSLPIRQVCGENCQGAPEIQEEEKPSLIDSRWASLEALKNKLS
jgi:uncharacterized protein